MSKFETNQFNKPHPGNDVREDATLTKAPRVVKTAQAPERIVQDFQMTRLGAGTGALANPNSQGPQSMPEGSGGRDQRFILSQLARDALSIGKEEERMIEARVEEKLAELTESTRAQAFEQGHAEGAKLGHEEAYQAFHAESTERLKKIDELIAAMEGAKTELFEANREFLMNVIYRVSKAVILKEVAADKEYLLRLARELIERCGLRENLTVKIHPTDIDSLEMIKKGLAQSFSTLRNLSVELSEHVQMGGCILETEWGAIDGSMETQLSQVLQTLDAPKGTTP